MSPSGCWAWRSPAGPGTSASSGHRDCCDAGDSVRKARRTKGSSCGGRLGQGAPCANTQEAAMCEEGSHEPPDAARTDESAPMGEPQQPVSRGPDRDGCTLPWPLGEMKSAGETQSASSDRTLTEVGQRHTDFSSIRQVTNRYQLPTGYAPPEDSAASLVERSPDAAACLPRRSTPNSESVHP